MIQKILFFSTEPKKSANARERVLFSSSFFILYLFPTSGAGKKKERARFLLEAGFFLSLSLCVCGDDDVDVLRVSESRADGNAMP
jgi:hypothetical protein